MYFAENGRGLAEFTATAAESAYISISKLLRYQLINRVPLIVYNSHNDFQQTNVVYEYMEEGIGGVTELFKNRVVIPFEGDYKKFRHVIHHELDREVDLRFSRLRPIEEVGHGIKKFQILDCGLRIGKI